MIVLRISVTFVFMSVCAVLSVSCHKDQGPSEKEELVVLCGSSFPQPMEQLCSEFTKQEGIEFATTAAGSENHLPLVKAASEGDIFGSSD